MTEFLYILLIILISIIIIGIPIILSFWIYRKFKNKRINSKWKILAFLPIFIVGYLIYDAFYPSSEFYATDFKEITGIELPITSEFNYKTSSYPDQHGDYNSVSIIEIGTEFYKNLQTRLIENGLSENGISLGCSELENAKKELNGLKIEREFSSEFNDKYYYVAFLSDKKTILVQRSSH